MLYNPVIAYLPSVLKYEENPLLTRHAILFAFKIDAINTATYRQVITILSFISLFFINPLLSCLNNSAVIAGAVNKISSWLIYFYRGYSSEIWLRLFPVVKNSVLLRLNSFL